MGVGWGVGPPGWVSPPPTRSLPLGPPAPPPLHFQAFSVAWVGLLDLHRLASLRAEMLRSAERTFEPFL